KTDSITPLNELIVPVILLIIPGIVPASSVKADIIDGKLDTTIDTISVIAGMKGAIALTTCTIALETTVTIPWKLDMIAGKTGAKAVTI
ncbi:hypothetical protein IR145_17445, partial [Streptococcus danieliae]|nr:hypothetical protein [Streptococcus danieliae]